MVKSLAPIDHATLCSYTAIIRTDDQKQHIDMYTKIVSPLYSCLLLIIRFQGHIRQVWLSFSYIIVVSFIGGRNLSTQRKPQTCR